MKKYIVLIIIPPFLFAFKKKSTVHIRARNTVTGKPYPGLKYSIVRSRTGMFESHYKTVASGSLNEDGEAYITKRFSKNWSHSITLERPDNYCYANELHYYFSGGENVEADFEYAECGYLKLSIHNVNCQNGDEIFYQRTWLINNDISNGVNRSGCFQFDGDYFSLPEGNYKYEWKVTKAGVSTVYDTTFFLAKDEHYHLNINY